MLYSSNILMLTKLATSINFETPFLVRYSLRILTNPFGVIFSSFPQQVSLFTQCAIIVEDSFQYVKFGY